MPEWPIGIALKAIVGGNVNRGFESRPLCAMKTVYRLDRLFALSLFGWRMVCAGVLAMAAFLLQGFGGFASVIGWVCAVLAALIFAAGLWILARPPFVVALDAQVFRLGGMAEGDVRKGHWATVEKVDTDQGRLVFLLDSGATGSIPLTLVRRRAAELQRDVHERLNAAHGYRRIN